MNKFEISIKIEDNPSLNIGYALFVEVNIDNKRFEDILDIHEFFRSLNEEGIFEYFTCTCGIFGCGGFYSIVEHSEKNYTLRNLYLPENEFSEEHIVETITVNLSWENVFSVAEEILEVIENFQKLNNGVKLTVGIAGAYAIPYIDEFKESLDKAKIVRKLKNIT